jgi:hypothetical protein
LSALLEKTGRSKTYSDPDPAAGSSHDDRGVLHRLPPNLDLRQVNECESTRRRDLQRRNGLSTEILTDGGTENGETVSETRVGSTTSALQLKLDGAETGGGGDGFSGGSRKEGDGATVAKLTGE